LKSSVNENIANREEKILKLKNHIDEIVYRKGDGIP